MTDLGLENALKLADFLASLPEECNVLMEDADRLVDVYDFALRKLQFADRPPKFNMRYVRARLDEGIVCCVLGWRSWLFPEDSKIYLNFEWCYSPHWSRVGDGAGTAQAAAHRIYYELAYGPPDKAMVGAVLKDWAAFVEAWPFETCRRDAHDKS